jgi:anti-anti-sigma factor|tara:strand:+ start:2717 stop:3214 length:498 start_codon:yes stop_codon:yes gene_type:complete
MTSVKVLAAEQDGVHVLKFVGDVRVTVGHAIDSFLEMVLKGEDFRSVIIDLTETVGIDSTSLGLLAKISIQTKKIHDIVPTIISTNDDITRILMSMGFDQVFLIINEPMTSRVELGELLIHNPPEHVVREKVLEAHQVLMELNKKNQLVFKDLVVALENERGLAT